jgi:hypothetical protein
MSDANEILSANRQDYAAILIATYAFGAPLDCIGVTPQGTDADGAPGAYTVTAYVP